MQARYDHMKVTIHKLQSRAEYYSDKIEHLSTSDVQNKEMGELVIAIANSSYGCHRLNEIFSEAEGVRKGLGGIVEGIWERDINEWKQFESDQEKIGSLN